jgi:hypothetical protein
MTFIIACTPLTWGSFGKLRKTIISFYMISGCPPACLPACLLACLPACLPDRPSVCPSLWDNLNPTGPIFTKFDIWLFSNIQLQKSILLPSDKNKNTFSAHLCISISHSIRLIMKNISVKCFRQIKKRILYSITFFRKSCCVWDNVKIYCRTGQATDDIKIRRMRIACWLNEATNAQNV